MATQKATDSLFDTSTKLFHGVRYETGDFSTFIPIAKLIGNNGTGPEIDLSLFYSPNNGDTIFENWSLKLPHVARLEQPGGGESESIFLPDGESWDLSDIQKTSLPNTIIKDPALPAAIIQKPGTWYSLATFAISKPLESLFGDYSLPTNIISPTGQSLNLEWERTVEKDSYLGTTAVSVRLRKISDNTTILLEVEYSSSNGKSIVKFNVFPRTPESYTHTFEGDLKTNYSSRAVLTTAKISNSPFTTKFEYAIDESRPNNAKIGGREN